LANEYALFEKTLGDKLKLRFRKNKIAGQGFGVFTAFKFKILNKNYCLVSVTI